jgi:hypothetical protein
LPEVFGRKPTPQSIRRRSNNNRYETGRPQHVGKPTLAELQTKLDGVRREVRNLTVMGMDPKQPPDQAELIKDLEQSARAEMRLRSHTPRASCVLIVRNARTLTRSCAVR